MPQLRHGREGNEKQGETELEGGGERGKLLLGVDTDSPHIFLAQFLINFAKNNENLDEEFFLKKGLRL